VPLQVTSCGEAAHPDRARSLRKALLEFCGSRSRKAATHGPIDAVRRVMPRDYVERQMAVAMLGEEEPRALEAMAEWVGQDGAELRRRLSGSVFAERRRVRLSELPTTPPEDVARGEDRLNLLAGPPAGGGTRDPLCRLLAGGLAGAGGEDHCPRPRERDDELPPHRLARRAAPARARRHAAAGWPA
jgi:hypothetical protein